MGIGCCETHRNVRAIVVILEEEFGPHLSLGFFLISFINMDLVRIPSAKSTGFLSDAVRIWYRFWAELCALIANVRPRPAVGPEFGCQVRGLQRRLGECTLAGTAPTMLPLSRFRPGLAPRVLCRECEDLWRGPGKHSGIEPADNAICEKAEGHQLTAFCLGALIEPGTRERDEERGLAGGSCRVSASQRVEIHEAHFLPCFFCARF